MSPNGSAARRHDSVSGPGRLRHSGSAERRRIGDIAFEHSLSDEAVFARAFKREIGVTAREARAAGGISTPELLDDPDINLSTPQRMMLWGVWMSDPG